jgi:hypothetical protein
MSTDPKPPKPMPSADEINAYLELSAARTKLRLPLAKGAARVGTPPDADQLAPATGEKPPPPISASKKLPTRQQQPSRTALAPADGEASAAEVWRPFPSDEKR